MMEFRRESSNQWMMIILSADFPQRIHKPSQGLRIIFLQGSIHCVYYFFVNCIFCPCEYLYWCVLSWVLQVESNETSSSPLEVGVFPSIKNCLSFSDLTILSADLLHEHVHSSVKEAAILEQLYRDAQTSEDNNYINQFLNSYVVGIYKNEDYLQVDDFAPGLNIENNHKQPCNSDDDEDEEVDLVSVNSFLSEYYNSESFYDQPEQLLFFNPFMRQNSNPENLVCMLT